MTQRVDAQGVAALIPIQRTHLCQLNQSGQRPHSWLRRLRLGKAEATAYCHNILKSSHHSPTGSPRYGNPPPHPAKAATATTQAGLAGACGLANHVLTVMASRPCVLRRCRLLRTYQCSTPAPGAHASAIKHNLTTRPTGIPDRHLWPLVAVTWPIK